MFLRNISRRGGSPAARAATGLQTDLYWDAGSRVDLDLYVTNNVVISNNTITSFKIVDSSAHDKGFESAMIKNTDPDGDYYLAIFYYEGSRAVNYTLGFSGPNISDTSQGSFTASNAGFAYFLGPIHKAGSTYSRLAGTWFNLEAIKPYLYEGKFRR